MSNSYILQSYIFINRSKILKGINNTRIQSWTYQNLAPTSCFFFCGTLTGVNKDLVPACVNPHHCERFTYHLNIDIVRLV